jgi:methylmalonyl-CoA mutase N-terminal domain/subunit
MFDEKTMKEASQLVEQWKQMCEKRYQGKNFDSTTNSGIPIKTVYTPLDTKDIQYGNDIGMPGVFPYMRDNYAIHYQFQPWINQQTHGYGLPEHTRERMDLLAKAGMKGYFGGRAYNLVWDLPSNMGIDPDEPEAIGYIGKDGVCCVTDEDFERMLHDLDLTKTNVVLINVDTLPIFAHFIAYADKAGFPREKLRGNTMNWQFTAWWCSSQLWEPEGGLKLATELIHFCCREMPNWNHTNLECHAFSEMGANAIQQMAFGIATAIAVADSCKEAGVDPDAYMPGMGFQIANCNDFFEYICMFRAWRRLWARITREKYGCKKASSSHLRVHTHTSCYELTKQQPLINLIRTTLHALGAVLSGTTAMELPGYDEPIGIPTEESAVLALRIQQIILDETGITKVTDPLGGSYFVEWLTDKIETEAKKLLLKIEEMGGFLQALRSGWLVTQCRENAVQWRREVDSGERTVIGWNKYAAAEEEKIKPFRVDPEVARTAVERIKQYKSDRDQQKTDQALERLVQAAAKLEQGEYGLLMPAAIEAAKAKATAGEISKALRKVFKWGTEYSSQTTY